LERWLGNRPDGEKLCREVYGDRVAVLPYVMPGFSLSKLARDAQAAHPSCEGLVLLKHGIFSFGATAREAYDRMIELVTLAETKLAGEKPTRFVAAKLPEKPAHAADVAPIVRGALGGVRFILEHRASERIMQFVNGRDVARYSHLGVATPDPRPDHRASPHTSRAALCAPHR